MQGRRNTSYAVVPAASRSSDYAVNGS